VLDVRALKSGLNFTLDTDKGELDLLGELTGLGGFGQLVSDSIEMELYGRKVRVLNLDGLERAKRMAGRLKDLSDLAIIAELKKRRP
jgi:hypothetical protein